LRILILANNDVGLYQFRKELIEELLKDNKVFISLPYGKLVEPLKAMGCKFIDAPVDRRGLNPFKDLELLIYYCELLKKVRPDLVITYTIKPNIYGSLACRALKIPYAVNITGLGTAFQKQGALRKLVTAMYKAALRSAKVVFFENCENQQIFIDERIVSKDKTCLLNGAGVNLEHYSYQEYPTDTEETRFLFIGRVMKEKGVNELFKAMRMLRKEGINCSLDVVGGLEENYEPIIQRFEKEGWLRYHGYQEDVRSFIKNCHCFVLPSWHEGMANTNLECAASGRPVITSNIHGCLESVVDGKSGFLCEKLNTKNLFEVMKRFAIETKDNKARMGILGRKHMVRNFDKKKVVINTIKSLDIIS
jgi:galacturonosyltransferase